MRLGDVEREVVVIAGRFTDQDLEAGLAETSVGAPFAAHVRRVCVTRAPRSQRKRVELRAAGITRALERLSVRNRVQEGGAATLPQHTGHTFEVSAHAK